MSIPTPPDLAGRLRMVREMAGLSARRLSILADCAEPHVGAIERADIPNPGSLGVMKIAKVLGVSLDWLLAGSGAPPDEAAIAAAVKRAEEQHSASQPAATGTEG